MHYYYYYYFYEVFEHLFQILFQSILPKSCVFHILCTYKQSKYIIFSIINEIETLIINIIYSRIVIRLCLTMQIQ